MRKTSYLWLAIPMVFVMSCKSKSSTGSDDTVAKRTVFFDKSGMDTTVKPADDFFDYANGAWMKNTVIPASESDWGSFTTLYNDNEANLHKIIEDAAAHDDTAGSIDQKVGDLYKSGMD